MQLMITACTETRFSQSASIVYGHVKCKTLLEFKNQVRSAYFILFCFFIQIIGKFSFI